MEDVVINPRGWRGKRVFLTGHTGFKGSWLALWLRRLGAEVYGYSLDPPTAPSLFEVAGVAEGLAGDERGDIRDYDRMQAALVAARPEVVIHFAAQPLVRASYQQPLETLAVNVMGSANLLEAVRSVESVRRVLIITTDKCYENREWPYPYRELDPLGGHDPYSASKACAELVTATYRSSFLAEQGRCVVATARAGNVIGGGDWADDRLVPDCVRAFAEGREVRLRYPDAVRPWQHVLEPLAGYLRLLEAMEEGVEYAEAWNFGPGAEGDATVGEVASTVARLWGDGRVVHVGNAGDPHEAGLLRLETTKARSKLGWRPRWDLERALGETVDWYRAWRRGEAMERVTLAQIERYEGAA